jgi:hypothetical protein
MAAMRMLFADGGWPVLPVNRDIGNSTGVSATVRQVGTNLPPAVFRGSSKASEPHPAATKSSFSDRFNTAFNRLFEALLVRYDLLVERVLEWPRATLGLFAVIFLLSLAVFPLLGLSYFPRTDPGQFVINFKAPSGTKLEFTARLEAMIRGTVSKHDIGMTGTNLGLDPGFSAALRRGGPRGAVEEGSASRGVLSFRGIGSWTSVSTPSGDTGAPRCRSRAAHEIV